MHACMHAKTNNNKNNSNNNNNNNNNNTAPTAKAQARHHILTDMAGAWPAGMLRRCHSRRTFMDMGPYVDCPGDEFFLISKHILATPQEQLEAIERTVLSAQQLGVPPTNKKLLALQRAAVDLRRQAVEQPKRIKEEAVTQPEVAESVGQHAIVKDEEAKEEVDGMIVKDEEVKEEVDETILKDEEVKEEDETIVKDEEVGEVDETLELLLAAGGEAYSVI